MGIKALCAAAAVVAGMGSAADAALLFTFDAVVTESELVCEYAEDCGLPNSNEYPYSVGETGVATIRVSQNKALLKFQGNYMYEGEVERYDSGWYESYIHRPFWNYLTLSWGPDRGFFSHYREDYPTFDAFSMALTNPTIAPVPLPATAALLPLGIGALAMVRRRRRP